MNILKAFNFYIILLVPYFIIFILDFRLLRKSFNHILQIDYHEMKLISQRSLAESIPYVREFYSKTKDDDTFLEKDNFIIKFPYSEYLLSQELFFKVNSENYSIEQATNDMESMLEKINSRFYFEGITLPLREMFNILNRMIERVMELPIESRMTRENLLQKIFELEKCATEELLKSLITSDEEVKYNIKDNMDKILDLVRRKLSLQNITLSDSVITKIATRISQSVDSAVIVYNEKFKNAPWKNEEYVQLYSNLHYEVMKDLLDIIYSKDYSHTARDVFFDSKLIMQTINGIAKKNNILLSYAQLRNMFIRVKECIRLTSLESISKSRISNMLKIFLLESDLVYEIAMQILNSGVQEDDIEYIAMTKAKTDNLLESQNIPLPEDVEQMAYRIKIYVSDIIS
ncbi:hypothetical protein PGAL8A_00412200 [Plasmodium gallinaceum]|uniref:Uncharacterized protein n=1 Tax=Plasmodium gallinaceum TaxID=5849 RepID=A0A1J1GW40_PLAGA|nr:hypothetical protein PGAL8A_00412200 [Plasmodium gallinaceum]CRG96540.1 hypothetical protein PGAL8A_00412200 [Plasmodium gallinaceum]